MWALSNVWNTPSIQCPHALCCRLSVCGASFREGNKKRGQTGDWPNPAMWICSFHHSGGSAVVCIKEDRFFLWFCTIFGLENMHKVKRYTDS